MFIPNDIIIIICEMDNSIPLHLLNKTFYKYYTKKRIRNINIIKRWYLSKKLDIKNNMSLQNIDKSSIIRYILSNKTNNNIYKSIITLPEFICLQLKNVKILKEMRSLPKHSDRKISHIVSFLLNKEIENHNIMNSFNIILRLLR
jgi:hypothetical protein